MDQRAHIRRKTLKHGSLILTSGGTKVDCIVRDLSPAGARIWRPHWVRLPPRFQLSIPGQLSVPVQLCWESGQEAGVRFVGIGMGRGRSSSRMFGKQPATAA